MDPILKFIMIILVRAIVSFFYMAKWNLQHKDKRKPLLCIKKILEF